MLVRCALERRVEALVEAQNSVTLPTTKLADRAITLGAAPLRTATIAVVPAATSTSTAASTSTAIEAATSSTGGGVGGGARSIAAVSHIQTLLPTHKLGEEFPEAEWFNTPAHSGNNRVIVRVETREDVGRHFFIF
jgi:hypothetical protein